MSMNADQYRVIEPVLTELAQGYTHPDRVGHVLFPRVEVNHSGGQILQFGKESFRRINLRRAPGAHTPRIGFGYEGKPYSLVQDSVDVGIPREHIREAETKAGPGVDLGKRAVKLTMEQVTQSLEIEQAELASNPDNYTDAQKLILAGGDQWHDGGSNPEQDIRAAKEAVRRACGGDPNRMVISSPIFNALKFHPKIVEKFKYTSADSVTTTMLANIFDLREVAVGKGVFLDNNAPEDAAFQDIWGNNAILAYTPVEVMGMEQPSYGYTYAMAKHPFVEKPHWDNDTRSWIYGTTYERRPVLSGVAAGFLIRNVVAEG